MSEMTRRQKTVLTRYVRQCADIFGLRDWKITVSDQSAPDDALADISRITGQKRAIIRFNRQFFVLTPDEQRSTVVHELLHCHFAGLDDFIANDLKTSGVMTADKCDLVNVAAVRWMEYGVDGVAEAIAKWFPAIEW